MNKTYSNTKTEPLSAKSLQKIIDMCGQAQSDIGLPFSPEVKPKWIKPLWILHDDFQALINMSFKAFKCQG